MELNASTGVVTHLTVLHGRQYRCDLRQGELAMLWLKEGSNCACGGKCDGSEQPNGGKKHRTSVSPKAQSTNESEARTLRPMSRLRERRRKTEGGRSPWSASIISNRSHRMTPRAIILTFPSDLLMFHVS